jgi:hypothetical protein
MIMREGLPQLKSAGPSRPLFVSNVPYAGRLPLWVTLGLVGLFVAFFALVFRDLLSERAQLKGPALVEAVAADYRQQLPRPISPSVTLIEVDAQDDRLILTHQISPEALSPQTTERDKTMMRAHLLSDACASAAYQFLFDEGLSLILQFKAKDGALLLTTTVSDESCKVAAR